MIFSAVFKLSESYWKPVCHLERLMMKCLAIYISRQTLLNARELKLLNFAKSDVTEQMNCMNQIWKLVGSYYKSSWESFVFNRLCPECSWATCGWYIMHWQWYPMYIELYICYTVVPVYMMFWYFSPVVNIFESVKELEIIQTWACMSNCLLMEMEDSFYFGCSRI